MGIPRFFYYCYKNFEQSIESLPETFPSTCKIRKTPVDFIHFDLNAIIHPVCQEVFKYGNFAPEKIDKFLLHKPKPVLPTVVKIKEVYEKVCQVIEVYVQTVKPKQGIYIAIDGVAGMSKCSQQRQRRFRTYESNEEINNKKFDPNCISTGTVFMDKLGKHIDIFLKTKVSNDWNNLECIFSNDKVAGEGEHKILKHLKLNQEISTVVVSPDADLFMLLLGASMMTTDRNIYIMRENIYSNVACKFFMADINELSQLIVKYVCPPKLNFSNHLIIQDFIFFCFMLGNDFLPNIPCVDLSNRGLDVLFEIYSQVLSNHGTIVKNDKIDKKAFVFMLRKISEKEEKVLQEKYKSNKSDSDPFLQKCLLDQNANKINMMKYRNMYNDIKLKDKEKACEEYIRGMIFVFKYYLDTIPSWTWNYKFHYAPFSSDIADMIEKNEEYLQQSFEKGVCMSPIQQLMCILPPKSKYLLPQCVQNYYNENHEILGKWFPNNIMIDYDFKLQEHEGIVIIPFIDDKDFINLFHKEVKQMTKEELARNKTGKVFVYFQELNEKTQQYECILEMVTPTL
jgi:5'-3' exonuclease